MSTWSKSAPVWYSFLRVQENFRIEQSQEMIFENDLSGTHNVASTSILLFHTFWLEKYKSKVYKNIFKYNTGADLEMIF